MSLQKLNAPDYVIHIFKGVRATARAIGRDPSAISKWRHVTKIVPTAAQRKILELAKRDKLDITPNDLVYGRAVRV